MIKPKLLLVDDDKNALDGLVKILTHDGYHVSGVLSGYEALGLLSKKNFDIIVTDMKLPGIGGLSLIHEIRKKEESVAIVVITAYSSVKTAVEAIKCGADDYLTKSINIEELRVVLEKIWERQQLIAQNRMLKEKLKDKYKSSGLVGSTPQMKQIFHMIADVAPSTASNRNLEKEVSEGRFREDLFYRLNVITIHLPSLRERREDIPILSNFFIIKYTTKYKKAIKGFTPEAMESLCAYHWPGNVRELENVVERAIVLCKKNTISVDHLPGNVVPDKDDMSVIKIPVGISLKEADKEIIQKTLQMTIGSKKEAARILSISHRKIEYKVKEWG